MELHYSRTKRLLILLMATCLFVSLSAHAMAGSMHPASSDCKIQVTCWACAVSLRSDSPDIRPVPMAALYESNIINTFPVIIPDPFYHPPR
jgi:hypothetical protein